MKLINTTAYSDYFLRRMISWCCREIGLPVGSVNEAKFCNRSNGDTTGRAWWPSNRIHLSVGSNLAKLVSTCAHELVHLWLYQEDGKWIAQEKKTRRHAVRVVEKFKASRDELLASWNKPPKLRASKPKPSLQEKRAEAARKKLAEWLRKQKFANTKVKRYKAKVRYYDQIMAAAGGSDRFSRFG